MWTHVKADIAERRDAELQEKYWRPMLEQGSQSQRFHDTFNSAWGIIDSIGKRTGDTRHVLLLQKELVDLHRRLSETQAGMALYAGLQKNLMEQRELIQKLRHDADMQNNELAMQELTAEYERIQDRLERTCGQVERMRMSLGLHLKLWPTFRKALPRSPAA